MSISNILTTVHSAFDNVVKWSNQHERIRKYLLYIGIAFGSIQIRKLFWFSYYKYYKYPPYISLGIPFLGCTMLMAKDQEKFTKSIVCKDGQLPLTSVPLGYGTVIYVNSFQIAKQILKTNEIGSNRPIFHNEFQQPP
eukprot:346361_1